MDLLLGVCVCVCVGGGGGGGGEEFWGFGGVLELQLKWETDFLNIHRGIQQQTIVVHFLSAFVP